MIRGLRLRGPFWLGVAVLVLVTVLAPADDHWLLRVAVGWDAGVAAFLLSTLHDVARARSIADIRRRAAELDQAGGSVLPLSLLAALASVVVIAASAARAPSVGSTAFALATLALSWLFVQVMFALHYAHEFYAPTDDGERRGLIFPGEAEADYWDFLHFSLVIGVANQTADIQISSRNLRRTVSLHGVIAWVFNAVILALAVNLAAALL